MSLHPSSVFFVFQATADAAHGLDQGGLLNKLLDLVDKYVFITQSKMDTTHFLRGYC